MMPFTDPLAASLSTERDTMMSVKVGTLGAGNESLLGERLAHRAISILTKRLLDVIGSALGLVMLSPLFFVLALLVRLSSEGPALFRQVRIGYRGKPFVCLKFRSMYASRDSEIHRNFVKLLISGECGALADESGAPVYKLTDDPRITPFGRFLRRSSLDELPQLLNVLKGEMSLVGPRPPIPYEWEMYEFWHQDRLMEVKPGITGLWQIKGRSTTTFEEMVRLDLQYAKEWSILFDLKLLLLTLWVLITSKGAY